MKVFCSKNPDIISGWKSGANFGLHLHNFSEYSPITKVGGFNIVGRGSNKMKLARLEDGAGMTCLLDRNDELFEKIEQKCLDDPIVFELDVVDFGMCSIIEDYDGTKHILLDSFAAPFEPVVIEAISIPNKGGRYLPRHVSFSTYAGPPSWMRYSSMIELPETRICEPREATEHVRSPESFASYHLSAFEHSLESYLQAQLSVDVLGVNEIEADRKILTSAAELAGLPPEVQQIYPTASVREFASGIDFEQSLENIVGQFTKLVSSEVSSYEFTPFAKREDRPSRLFVCRRTASEILASKFAFGCGERATLFLAVLMAGQLQARIVKAVASEPYAGGSGYPGHDLVEVFDAAEGRWILVDSALGEVYRKYRGERQFRDAITNWIRMGDWKSNWGAACHDYLDLDAMRAEAVERFASAGTIFVDIRNSNSRVIFR